MIASVENIQQFILECLYSDPRKGEMIKPSRFAKILYEKYCFTCETLNDFCRLQCAYWLIDSLCDRSYIYGANFHMAWFMVVELSTKLSKLYPYDKKNTDKLKRQIHKDYDALMDINHAEFSKCYTRNNTTETKFVDNIYNIILQCTDEYPIVDTECPYVLVDFKDSVLHL